MYARTVTRPKPIKSQLKEWPAPTVGWIANRALATPNSLEGPGAAILDNFFPKATTVALRRGKQRYATLEDTSLDVTALFSYKNGNNRHLFAANATTIYDITSVPFPVDAEIVTEDDDLIVTDMGDWFGWSSTDGLAVSSGYTGGDWIVTQFATTGGVYLIGVNGENTGFIYDGTTFFPNADGGAWLLSYDALTAPFTLGDTVTGGTSGATGVILAIHETTATTGYLILGSLATPPFVDNELITDVGGGSADTVGAEVVLTLGITFGTSGLTTADMSFVWVYKSRLWFVQKDSLSVWYLDADSIGGDATEFPMGGIFTDGGSLMFGQAWSLDSSGDAGLSQQCVFVSDQGQVAVYQGDDPSTASTWQNVGVYRIGIPLGKRAFLRGGGDLAICTSVGLVPLSKAISLDVTALNVATVSYNISDAWKDANDFRGRENWQAILWPEEKMSLISPPRLSGSNFPVIFIANTETGAWCRYTGWEAFSFEVFEGQLYFGSSLGQIFQANVAGNDDGLPYTGAVLPLFDDLGAPASIKVMKVGRPRTRATARLRDSMAINVNFDMSVNTPPDASPVGGTNLWGSGIWGTSVWSSATPTLQQMDWRSMAGIGYTVSPLYQVTSGSIGPLDVELIAMELTYTVATIIS